MKIVKKNQIIIYVIVLILMVAGYLNYTNNTDKQVSVETAMKMDANDDTKLSDIGDAKLVNSNDIVEEENNTTIDTNNTTNETSEQNMTSNTVETSTTNENNNYFVQSKLERDNMYSEMLETYENILNSSNSSETQRQSATEEIKKINDTKNSIMICENLIKTKGFENSIIFVNGESINIIIGVNELKQEEIAQIQNIISREMNAEISNIHIINK